MTWSIEFGPVTEADFDELLALRLETMRDSLERIGRFDPHRAEARFRESFRAPDTRRILVDRKSAGCVGFWPEGADAMRIEHFYIAAPYQRMGIGSAVIIALLKDMPATVKRIRVGALRGSDAIRFYQRHGFLPIRETEWDIEHERPHSFHAAAG